MLVNPELGGITLGWNLLHTAADELFAAIEGTAFHTRVILERMEQHGVPIDRVINGGGIPAKNDVLNRVYANVLNKPVLVPETEVTSLGSAIFAFLAAGEFDSIEAAQERLCPRHRIVQPDPAAAAVYQQLYEIYKRLYFGFGQNTPDSFHAGDVLPSLRKIAAAARGNAMSFDALRAEVLEANLELVRRELVLYTFGNASGIDRKQGLVAIKPSGVPYDQMTPGDIVIVNLEGETVREPCALLRIWPLT